MTPEEQNAVQVREKLDNYVQRKVGAWKQWKEQTDAQYSNQQSAKLENDTMTLYKSGLDATNEQAKKQYDIATRANLLAEMVSDRAKDQGYAISGNATDIVKTYLQNNPSQFQAFKEFTHSDQDPEDFAIQMGWMEKPGVFKRGLKAIGGAIGGVAEGTWEALKRAYNNMGDIKDIAQDDNKSFIEKFNQILLGEIVLDTVGGSIGDVIGGGIEGAFKGATTAGERRKMSDAVAGFIQTVLETDMGQDAINRWYNLTPEQKKEAEDYLTYLDGAMNLTIAGTAKEPIKAGIRGGEKIARTVVKEAKPIIKGAETGIKESIEKQVAKNAIKNAAKSEAGMRNVANVIGQGATTDIDNSVKALQTMAKHSDLKALSSFQEIDNAGNAVERKLLQTVDENLEKYAGKVIKASDQKSMIVDGQEMGRYVDDAIADLKDVYTRQRNVNGLKELADFEKKFQGEGVSYKELNDFARRYGGEMDAWNAKNQLTTDAKVGTEQTRKGIKGLIQERVPDAEFKNIDAEIGSIANFRKLIQKSIEKANNTEKTLREKGVLESAMKTYSDIKNTITGAPKGETENLYHIQDRLPKLLKEFDDLNNQLEKASKSEAEKLIKGFNSELNPN